jgi:hypothetical protein
MRLLHAWRLPAGDPVVLTGAELRAILAEAA